VISGATDRIQSTKFFSRANFIQRLLNIGYKYTTDEKILEQVIRSLKTISERCDIKAQALNNISEINEVKTQSLYDFLFGYKDSENKTIKRLVAYALPSFPQFDAYEQKWEYLLSMPKIAPRKDSMDMFRWIIKERINEIPDDIKVKVINLLQSFVDKNDLHKYTFTEYSDVIKQLNN